MLTASYGHGTLAVPDQLVDRASGREQTVFGSGAVHVVFADLYCLVGRAHALATACASG